MRKGSSFFKPNERIATCLVLEANLGLRISDILNLKMSDIIKDGDRYRLDITEKKTSKKDHSLFLYQFINIFKSIV